MRLATKLKQMLTSRKLLLSGVILVVAFVLALCVQKPEEKPTPTPVQPAKELKLSDFPEVFKENTLIVLGDNASKQRLKIENTEDKQNRQIENPNLSIKAKNYSSILSITNTGNVPLTNIKIVKDRYFTNEGIKMRNEVIRIIPKLDVNESLNVSIKEISSCGFLPEERNLTAQNEGWIIVTCDQGITKKIAFCEVVPHTIPSYPSPLKLFIFYILPPVLFIFLIFGIIRYISKIRRQKR